MNAIARLGRDTLERVAGIGAAAQLLGRTLWMLPSWRGMGLFIEQMYRVGVLSLLIILVSGLFIGIWIARVEDRLSAAPAPEWACAPCALATGDCAGFIERLSWTSNRMLAEYSQTWFDPAVCRYSSRLSQ